ncbi:MAG: DNA polymerase [Mycobacteriaceae bacterium]
MIADVLLFWLSQQDVVAVDTETDGLAWEARVRLVQFGNAQGGFAIDVEAGPAGAAIVRQALRVFRGQLVFHNAPFDIHRLEQLGVDPDRLWPRAFNTHVEHHVLNPAADHGLKDIAAALYGPEVREPEREMKALAKKRKVKWWQLPTRELASYGIQDTVLTARLHMDLSSELSPVEWDVVGTEMEVAQAVAAVSGKGMRLDVPYAHQLHQTMTADEATDLLWFADRGVTKPNSARQMWDALREVEGRIPDKYTKTGEPQLDKTVIGELMVDGSELATRLKAFKRRGKWRSAYVENCLMEVDSTGRVHASYNSLGAKTGRMSCSNPPLQQLPKGGGGEIRRLFIASEGNVITSVDYSQIEMRLAAHFAQDPFLMRQFAEGIDVYDVMKDRIGCTRPQAKIASLAALYGSKGKSIAVALGITPAESVAIVTRFWQEYPYLNRWSVAAENRARGGGVVKSRWGRSLRPHMPYAAGNSIIQGTAAEVMKEGLLRLAENNLLQYVVAIVHDEVVLDVPVADSEALTNEVGVLLADHSFDVELSVEGEVYGPSWGDGYAVAA